MLVSVGQEGMLWIYYLLRLLPALLLLLLLLLFGPKADRRTLTFAVSSQHIPAASARPPSW